ncbi:MAG: hypothetical protein KJO46_00715 [Gammaproteobacteria bacterium]|nr:hypothetical protein [Gammaproteobacteria bacterium]
MIDSISFRTSAVVLVVANLVPLFGVLLFDWQVFHVVLLYWVENVVIGLINVMRMFVAGPGRKYSLALFFVAHYGIFCFAHLQALVTLFDGPEQIVAVWELYFSMPLERLPRSPLWIGIAAIAASHLFSFFVNFIAGGEYRRTTISKLMGRPYGRIVVLQLAILLGAALIEWLDTPLGLLLALIGVKIFMDLRAHSAERDAFQKNASAQQPALGE